MNARDIDAAAVEAGIRPPTLCAAFQTVLPVLKQLARKQNFVTRLFIAGFVAAIEGYVAEKCG